MLPLTIQRRSIEVHTRLRVSINPVTHPSHTTNPHTLVYHNEEVLIMNRLSLNLLALQCLSFENLLQLKVRTIVDFLFRPRFRTVRLTREKWDERCSGDVTIH